MHGWTGYSRYKEVVSSYSGGYMESIRSFHISSATERLSFSVAVNSPVCTEKSRGAIANFWIFHALLRQMLGLLLVFSMPAWMYFCQTGSFIAWEMVVTPGLTS